MRQIFFFLLVTLFISGPAIAQHKDINAIIKAEAKNGADLTELLKDITLVSAKGSKSSKGLMKVSKVAKGSVYEKYGVKKGDLVYMSFDGNFEPVPKSSN